MTRGYLEPGSAETWGARALRSWLDANGLSKRALSSQLGKSNPYVSMLCSGQQTPHLSVAVQIEDLTGIPPRAWVLFDEEEKLLVSRSTPLDERLSDTFDAISAFRSSLNRLEKSLSECRKPTTERKN